MVRKLFIFLTIFLVLIILMSSCDLPGRQMSMGIYRGSPEILRNGEKDWNILSESTKIGIGDSIRSGENGWVRLDITDGSLISLAPETEIKLIALSNGFKDPITLVELINGELMVQVTKDLGEGSFKITTDVASAGVVGSQMSVDYQKDTGGFEVGCYDGTVRAEMGGGQDSQVIYRGDVIGISGNSSKNQFSTRPMDEKDTQKYAALMWWGGANTPGMTVRVKSPTPSETPVPTKKPTQPTATEQNLEFVLTKLNSTPSRTPQLKYPTITVDPNETPSVEEQENSGSHVYSFTATASGNCKVPASGNISIKIDFVENQVVLSGSGGISTFDKVAENTFQGVDQEDNVTILTFNDSGFQVVTPCTSMDYERSE
ncbi:MAG: hypothetical protein C0410_15530 [Anaerolinea sp.]|nr:hypothetical protein [Anaerolinea sp.]